MKLIDMLKEADPLGGSLKDFINKLIKDNKVSGEVYNDLKYLGDNLNDAKVVNAIESLLSISPTKRSIIRGSNDRLVDLLYYALSTDNSIKSNFYGELRNHLQSLLDDVKQVKVQNKDSLPDYSDLHDIHSINNTTNLKKYKIVNRDRNVYLGDKNFLSIMSFDKETEVYVNAIKNKNLNIKANPNTDIGLLYSFYKDLYRKCQSGTEAMDYLSYQYNMKSKTGKDGNLEFKNISTLDIKSLDDRNSIVNMDYIVYDSNGTKVGGVQNGTFLFYQLVKTYQFIDQEDKNTFFQFRGEVPKETVITKKPYTVFYSSSDLDMQKAPVRISFLKFALANNKDVEKENIVPACNSLDEFMRIFDSYDKNREAFKYR